MRIVSLAEVKTRLSAYIDQARTEGPVVITRNGQAVAVLLAPYDDDDLESILMARSPRFQAVLEQSRQRLRAGGGLGEEEFWKAVEEQGSMSSE
jgi:prevent-host-death family protein